MGHVSEKITAEQQRILLAALKVGFDLLMIKREWEFQNHLAFFRKQEKNKGKAFIVIALLLLIFSQSYSACQCMPHGYNFAGSPDYPITYDGQCIANATMRCRIQGTNWYGYSLIECRNIIANDCASTLDSIQCVNDGSNWNSAQKQCDPPCDAQCQCDSSGGTWNEHGYCVPNCETKKCCDSLNTALPVELDTSFMGCVGGSSGGCEEKHSYDLNGQQINTFYECNGLASYSICQTQYAYDNTGNCSRVPSRECVDITQQEERCSNVRCDEVWETDYSEFKQNQETLCWDGKTRLVLHMECDNGERTLPSYGEWKNSTVCESWLDSNNTTIDDYLHSSLPGGPSMDNQGNIVENSPGPGGDDDFSIVDRLVTQVDSVTGEVTIVKNSAGKDSIKKDTVYNNVKCIGVSGGYATLKQGSSTWTCPAQSCIQAELKYRMGTGCSSNASPSNTLDEYYDVNASSPTVSFKDSVSHDGEGVSDYDDVLNNLSRTATWFYNFFAFPSTYKSFADAVNAIVTSVNSGAERTLAKSDSIYERSKEELWKRVFGSDLSGVTDLASSVTSASSANSQAIGDATSTLSTNISAASQRIASATSNVTLAVGDVSVNISNKIMSASSANSQAIGDAVSAVTDKITSVSSRHLDTLHGIHSTLDVMDGAIAGALDTGGIFKQTRDSLHAFHSSFSDYVNLVTEHQTLMQTITQSVRDTSHNTNVILSEISDKLDNISPASSSSEQYAEVDTSYLDTGDYELDVDLVYQDSVLSDEIQVISDSIKGMAGALKRGMDSVFAHVDSVRADTNNNFLAMDSIYKWHKDTTKIKQKFSQFFLPSQMSNDCFVCTYNEKWWKFDVDLSFNLGNVYGLNLCELLRNIVKVIVTICIIFSTIGAFIRAFGGGGGGSP